MKKNFTYYLVALLIFISFVNPVNAQVNGIAAKPLVSTTESPVYYYIESAADASVNLSGGGKDYRGHLLYSPTSTDGVNFKHDLKATIEGASINIDNALWQIVVESGVQKLKNKGSNLFLQDARFGKTIATNPFVLVTLNSPVQQYSLRNSNQANPAVAWNSAANGNYLDRWSSTAPNSQVAWYFIVAPGSEANYTDALNAQIKVSFDAKVVEAENLIALTTEGVGFGQYTVDARSALSAAIVGALAVQADNTKTNEEILAATTTLNAAITTYKSAINANPVSLLSASSSNYRWYWIKSTSASAYAQNAVISAAARLSGEKFTFEPKAAEVSDAQLFRFELTEDQTKVLNIVNKSGGYMASNGAIATVSTPSNTFSLNLLADGYSFNIKPTSVDALHAQQTGAHIVNWAGVAGTSSAWVFEYALETSRVTTALNKYEMSEYKIRVSDRMIFVEGESDYEVYALTGQKQDKYNALATGVYFVKLKNATLKVMVK